MSLGMAYFEGNGVPQSDLLSYMWWEVAALQDNQAAATLRDKFGTLLIQVTINKAKQLARECVEKDFKKC